MVRLKIIQELKSIAHFRLDDDVAGTQVAGNTPYLLEDQDSWAGKQVFDHAQVIEQLDMGSKIQGKTISFGFLDGTGPQNPAAEFEGFSPLSESQRATARDSMELWDDLIAARVVEKGGNRADIVFGNTTTGPAQAWAYYPTENGDPSTPQSSVWIADPDVNWTNAWVSYGGYGQSTMVHEIGHSLGLSHPGAYNFGADEDGDGQADPIRYATPNMRRTRRNIRSCPIS